MPVRDILRVFAVLLISSSFHKCAECALVIKPQDAVAVTGEVATFNCSSNASKCGNIAWSVRESSNYIYALNETSPNVAKYINVTNRDDGNCSLNINASLAVANRYICRELDSGNEASAELTVMENKAKCSRESKNLSLHISCSFVSSGKWAPTVVCEQVIDDKEHSFLQQYKTPKLDVSSNGVTSTWNFNSKKDSCNTKITCRTEFKHHGRSTETIEAYCTPCSFEKTGFYSSNRFLNIDESKLWSDPNYNGCFNQAFRDLLQEFNTNLFRLSIICYAVSLIALVLTIIAYVINWKQYESGQAAFLINLCVALILAYLFCLVGIQDPSALKIGCKAIILLLQYFILTAFSSLLAEGCRLLTYISSGFLNRRRRIKETSALIAAAWVLPIIIVGVSAAYRNVNDDGSDLVCLLLLEKNFIWAFVVPVLCLFTAHVIVSIIVLRCLSRNIGNLPIDVKIRNQIRATLWNMLVTCPVLFLGSLFGALSIAYSSALFLNLFVLINSLQGLLIFIFHVHYNIKKPTVTCCIFNSQPGHIGVELHQTMPPKEPERELSSVNSEPGLSGDDQTMSKAPERELSSVNSQSGFRNNDWAVSTKTSEWS